MKTFLIIDANSLIHRSFHALPPFTTPGGEPVGAIYGAANTIIKTIKEIGPDYIAAAFDRPEPTFRKKEFKEYKAHRPVTPNELISQIKKTRELFKEFNVRTLEEPGFEADDIIGTLVKRFSKSIDKIIILTGDLDTLALVKDESVTVKTPGKKGSTTSYDQKAVFERYGIEPEKMADFKALVGDSSDNIPGIEGIGPKRASEVIKKYGSLEKILKKNKTSDPLLEKITSQRKNVLLFKKLVTIDTNVPILLKLKDFKFEPPENEKLIEYFKDLGFSSLVKRLSLEDDIKNIDPRTIDAKEVLFVEDGFEKIRRLRIDLSSDKIKIAHNWKTILKTAISEKLSIKEPLFDLSLAHWLISPASETLLPPSSPKEGLESFYILKEKIINLSLERVFYDIEMPTIPVLARMEKWGIKINRKKLLNLKKELDKETGVLSGEIHKLAGEEFNINSPKQVGNILFKKLGIKSDNKSKKPKTGKERLILIEEEHPIVKLIIKYRESFKIKTGFVEPLLKASNRKPRMETEFNQAGAITGRIISEKPNLQNLPQESRWSKKLRSSFESEKGWSFLSIDYSQLELRLLAHLSGDDDLKRSFLRNEDVHKKTAARILGIPEKNITPSLRKIGKVLNFGIIYGMGSRLIAQTAGIDKDQASLFLKKYFDLFPGVGKWREDVKREALSTGFIKNLNGRRRRVSDIPGANISKIERIAINMPVQSLEADILKLALINCSKLIIRKGWEGKSAKIILPIHDELLFEVKDDILNEAVDLLKKETEKTYSISVPLKVEIKKGKDWGSLNKFNGSENENNFSFL